MHSEAARHNDFEQKNVVKGHAMLSGTERFSMNFNKHMQIRHRNMVRISLSGPVRVGTVPAAKAPSPQHPALSKFWSVLGYWGPKIRRSFGTSKIRPRCRSFMPYFADTGSAVFVLLEFRKAHGSWRLALETSTFLDGSKNMIHPLTGRLRQSRFYLHCTGRSKDSSSVSCVPAFERNNCLPESWRTTTCSSKRRLTR